MCSIFEGAGSNHGVSHFVRAACSSGNPNSKAEFNVDGNVMKHCLIVLAC